MVIQAFKHTKRDNEIKIPTSGVDIAVELKDTCSIETPVFEFDARSYDIGFNYFYVPLWGRYYFVNGRTYRVGKWYISMIEDTLNSFATPILNHVTFIKRASSVYDIAIPDNALTQKQGIVHTIMRNTNLSVFSHGTTGCYLVRVAGATTGSVTGVTTYAMNEGNVSALLNYMYNDSILPASWQDTIVKAVFNPFEYVLSIKWVPFTMSDIAGNTTERNVKLGWWETNAHGYIVNKVALGYTVTLNSAGYYFNDWREYAPEYTDAHIWIPGVGLVQVNPEIFKHTITLSYFIDCATGLGTVYLRGTDAQGQGGYIIGSYNLTLCAEIQLSQSKADAQSIISSGVSAGAYAFSQNWLMAGTSLVQGALASVRPTHTEKGVNGSRASIIGYLDAYIIKVYRGSAEYPLNVAGRPLCQNRRIGDLTGFVQCEGASISLEGTKNEISEVNNYLNSGFYIS